MSHECADTLLEYSMKGLECIYKIMTMNFGLILCVKNLFFRTARSKMPQSLFQPARGRFIHIMEGNLICSSALLLVLEAMQKTLKAVQELSRRPEAR